MSKSVYRKTDGCGGVGIIKETAKGYSVSYEIPELYLSWCQAKTLGEAHKYLQDMQDEALETA